MLPLNCNDYVITYFFLYDLGKLLDRVFLRVTKVNGLTVVTVHQRNQSRHQITEVSQNSNLAMTQIPRSSPFLCSDLMYIKDLVWFPGENI